MVEPDRLKIGASCTTPQCVTSHAQTVRKSDDFIPWVKLNGRYTWRRAQGLSGRGINGDTTNGLTFRSAIYASGRLCLWILLLVNSLSTWICNKTVQGKNKIMEQLNEVYCTNRKCSARNFKCCNKHCYVAYYESIEENKSPEFLLEETEQKEMYKKISLQYFNAVGVICREKK